MVSNIGEGFVGQAGFALWPQIGPKSLLLAMTYLNPPK
jgi:hypothetical protein